MKQRQIITNMMRILPLLLLLLTSLSFSQNYTIKTDSVMTMVKQGNDLNYTEFKASTAIITIADSKCLFKNNNGLTIYNINAHDLITGEDTIMKFTCELNGKLYALQLIIQSDKKKLFIISDNSKTTVYTVTSLNKG